MFYLVTGGSGSGKSAFAEQTICKIQKETNSKHLYYIATMYPYGKETEKKIERHRKMREGKGFETIECYRKLSEVLKEQSYFHERMQQEGICVLLECMSNLVANELYMDLSLNEDEKDIQNISKRIADEIQELRNTCKGLVVVTNEVFSEGRPQTKEMEEYLQVLGNVNQNMGKAADGVSEIVYGIEVKIKG